MNDGQAFYEQVQRREEWEEDQRRAADEAFQRAMIEKWPGVKLWPGKDKSPVLSSGNGPGFEPQSNQTQPGQDHGQNL